VRDSIWWKRNPSSVGLGFAPGQSHRSRNNASENGCYAGEPQYLQIAVLVHKDVARFLKEVMGWDIGVCFESWHSQDRDERHLQNGRISDHAADNQDGNI
jgi:hypothetical protein